MFEKKQYTLVYDQYQLPDNFIFLNVITTLGSP